MVVFILAVLERKLSLEVGVTYMAVIMWCAEEALLSKYPLFGGSTIQFQRFHDLLKAYYRKRPFKWYHHYLGDIGEIKEFANTHAWSQGRKINYAPNKILTPHLKGLSF